MKLDRDKYGFIIVFPKEDRLIWDIYLVLKGIPKDRPIKRAIMGIDLSVPGAVTRPAAANNITYFRELNGRPEPVTGSQINKAFQLIRGIFAEREKDLRYGFDVNFGTGGPNATGESRFYITENDESIKKDDPRILAITAGDNYNSQVIVTRLLHKCEYSKFMWENTTDLILKARWRIKMGQENVALGEAELAAQLSYI